MVASKIKKRGENEQDNQGLDLVIEAPHLKPPVKFDHQHLAPTWPYTLPSWWTG